MQNFAGKTALVTGGGSGIGLALVAAGLQRGMRVVAVDVDAAALEQAAAELGNPETLITECVDVADAQAMAALAERISQTCGPVQLLCNNAGVGGGGNLWEQSDADWDWVLGVNLKAVIHGVRLFTPGMIAAGEGHIVNTASIAGLMSAPGTSTYTVSKHAVVALSEVLAGDLRNAQAGVGVSVLCPSFVNTRIYDFERSRPESAARELSAQERAEQEAIAAASAEFFSTALAPERVAEQVFAAIENNEFYVLTHPEGSREQVARRMQAILDGEQPPAQGPQDFPLA